MTTRRVDIYTRRSSRGNDRDFIPLPSASRLRYSASKIIQAERIDAERESPPTRRRECKNCNFIRTAGGINVETLRKLQINTGAFDIELVSPALGPLPIKKKKKRNEDNLYDASIVSRARNCEKRVFESLRRRDTRSDALDAIGIEHNVCGGADGGAGRISENERVVYTLVADI